MNPSHDFFAPPPSKRESSHYKARWTAEYGIKNLQEDAKLGDVVRAMIPKFPAGTEWNWWLVAEQLPERNAKQCRERWQQVLDPDLNRETWSEEELNRLEDLIIKHGTQWGVIAKELGTNRPTLALRNAYYARQRRAERLVVRQAAAGATAANITAAAASRGILQLGPTRHKRPRAAVAAGLLSRIASSGPMSAPDGTALDAVTLFTILQAAIQGNVPITPFVAGLLQANGIFPGPDGKFPFQADEGASSAPDSSSAAGNSGSEPAAKRAALAGGGASSSNASLPLVPGLHGLGGIPGLSGLFHGGLTGLSAGLGGYPGVGMPAPPSGPDMSNLVEQFSGYGAAADSDAQWQPGQMSNSGGGTQLDALAALYGGASLSSAGAPTTGGYAHSLEGLAQMMTAGAASAGAGVPTGGQEMSVHALFGLSPPPAGAKMHTKNM